MTEERIKIHENLMGKEWASILTTAIQYAEDKVYPFLKKIKDEVVYYPNADTMYKAFKLTNPNKLRVVILGQD